MGTSRESRVRSAACTLRGALAPLRVLVPSWRFFDDIASPLTLEARCGARGGELGPWLRLWPESSSTRRPLRRLLLDPDGNLGLAYYGLLERLQGDLAELDEGDADGAERLVSYELVLNLVRRLLAARPDTRSAERLQFRLTAASEASPAAGDPVEILLRSAIHAL